MAVIQKYVTNNGPTSSNAGNWRELYSSLIKPRNEQRQAQQKQDKYVESVIKIFEDNNKKIEQFRAESKVSPVTGLGLNILGGTLNVSRAVNDLRFGKGIKPATDAILEYQKYNGIAPEPTKNTSPSSIGKLSDIEHGQYGTAGSLVTAPIGGLIRVVEDLKAQSEGKKISAQKQLADLGLAGLDIATLGGGKFLVKGAGKAAEKMGAKELLQQGAKYIAKKTAIETAKGATIGAVGGGLYGVSEGMDAKGITTSAGIGAGLAGVLSGIGGRAAAKESINTSAKKVLGSVLKVPKEEISARMSLASDIADLSNGKYGITKKNVNQLANNPAVKTSDLELAVAELRQEGTWSKASRPTTKYGVDINTKETLALPAPTTQGVLIPDKASNIQPLLEQKKSLESDLRDAITAKNSGTLDPSMVETVDKTIAIEQKNLSKVNSDLAKSQELVSEAKMTPDYQGNPVETTLTPTKTTIRKPNSWYINERLKGNHVSAEGDAFVNGATGAGTGTKASAKANSRAIVEDAKSTSVIKEADTRTYRKDPLQRVFQKVLGKNYDDFSAKYLQPFFDSKGVLARNTVAKHAQIREVFDGISDKKSSSLVQQLGEGKIDYASVVKNVGETKAVKIQSAVDKSRALYDEWFKELQVADPKVKYRKDYFRHMQEYSGSVENILNPTEGVSLLPSGIKPRGRKLGLSMQRTGEETVDDAVTGMMRYADALEYNKNINPHVAIFRDLAKGFSESGNKKTASYLTEYVDRLVGLKDAGDIAISKVAPRMWEGLKFVNRKSKGAVILGNVAQPFVQAANLPIVVAEVGPVNFSRSFGNFVKDYANGFKFQDEVSDFLVERYALNASKDRLLDVGIFGPVKKVMKGMLTISDEMVARSGWQAAFDDGMRKGMSTKNASFFADSKIRDSVGGRGVGDLPLNQNTEIMQELAPFTLEVQNQMRKYVQYIGEKNVGKIATVVISSWLMNRMYEQVLGRKVNFDPADAVTDAVAIVRDPDMSIEEKALRSGGRMLGEYLGSIPYGQQIAGVMPVEGYKLGDKQLSRKDIFGSEDPTKYGTGVAGMLAYKPIQGTVEDIGRVMSGTNTKSAGDIALGTAKDVATYTTPGGKQLRNWGEAASDLQRGNTVSSAGKYQYKTPTDVDSVLRAFTSGKFTTERGKEYLKNNETMYSNKKLASLTSITDQDIKDVAIAKEDNSNLSKTQAAYKIVKSLKDAQDQKKSTQTINDLAKIVSDMGINQDDALKYGKDYANEKSNLTKRMSKEEKTMNAFSEKELTRVLKERGKKLSDYPVLNEYKLRYGGK